jgi:biopolymer transport protein TolQ
MGAFHGIGLSGSASLATVAPGISEALVATAIGLVAAIPAVIGYNHFINKVNLLCGEMDNFSQEFLNIVQRAKRGD